MATHSFLENRLRCPEVIIGIMSPVGTNIVPIRDSIRQYFERHGYVYHHIKVSEVIESLASYFPSSRLRTDSKIRRVNSFINLGNRLRKRLGNDILAALSIAKVNEARFDADEESSFESRVFVIDQLKTEGELDLLREVYGPNFFQVSVYSSRDNRVDNLARGEAHDPPLRRKEPLSQ